jgi:hypothetical protein
MIDEKAIDQPGGNILKRKRSFVLGEPLPLPHL